MTSKNCIEGLRCPECGNETRLLIIATAVAEVTDNGAELADGDGLDWSDKSHTFCPECKHGGPLTGFRTSTTLPSRKPYRIRIEVDITAADREQAERRMSLVCSDIEKRPWVVAVLPDGIEERIPVPKRKESP